MMNAKTWLITGISSGFGRSLTEQLLRAGHRVAGTVRGTQRVKDLTDAYPDTFTAWELDVTDGAAIRRVVDQATERLGGLDVVISNAGYGLFGAAEELSDEQVEQILATNLAGSITLIRAVLPIMRHQGYGRIIQLSSVGGQIAFAGNALYHATKWGIEGFCETVAQEVAPFGIGVTIVEPGGARTEFRYGSAQVATAIDAYDATPAHAFRTMLDPAKGLAPGDPEKMAARIIESVAKEPAPLRLPLGSKALRDIRTTLQARLDAYTADDALAESTDIIE